MVAVALQVGLVHHVESVVVTKGVEAWVVWIMARANRIEVVLLHQQHVSHHALQRHGLAVCGVGIVAVGTLEEHAAVVDVHPSAPVLYLAETVLLGADIAVDGHVYRIEVRRFGSPQERVLHVHGHVQGSCAALGHRLGVSHDSLRHRLAVGTDESHIGLDVAHLLAHIEHLQLHVQLGLLEVVAQLGGEIHVLGVELLSGLQIHLAMDAAHAEHVLILEVRTV